MEKIRPLFIAMTPVRNEAWVLHAFLKTTMILLKPIICRTLEAYG